MKKMEKCLRIYIIAMMAIFLCSCGAIDFVLGKDKETVIREIDTNKDGKLSKREIVASEYDLNRDGVLSAEELAGAMAPNPMTDGLLAILSALNVPLIGAATYGLKQARKNREHITGLIAAGEVIKDKITNEEVLTRDGLKDIYITSKNAYSKDGKHLTKIYNEVKEIINKQRHGYVEVEKEI
jgi:hypothetical protein